MKLIEKVRETTKVLKTLSRKPRRQPPQRLQARVRATTTATADDYEDEEPQTKLTSAFVVVLVLHIVAVGGIYAFNQIKASRTHVASTGPAAATPASASNGGANASIANAEGSATKAAGDQPAATGNGLVATKTTNASASAPAAPPLKTQPYTIKSGDTLAAIARSHGTNVTDLKAINNLTSDSIRPGQVLNVPVPAKVAANPATEPAPVKKTEPAASATPTKTYMVKSGDRLIFIAKRFDVSPNDIVALNKIKDPTKLQIGQTLKIPVKK